MSKVIDLRRNGGDLVVLGKAIVLPSSSADGTALPLDGSTRYNPDTDTVEVFARELWGPIDAYDEDVVAPHNHTIAQVATLQTTLANKSPVAHGHTIGDVTGLQAALDAKSDTVHAEAIANITNLQETLAGLQTAIDGKVAVTHTHAMVSITGIQTALNSKAPVAHTHAMNTITGFNAQWGFYHTYHLDMTFDATTDTVYLPICIRSRLFSEFDGTKVAAPPVTAEVRIHVAQRASTGTAYPIGDIVISASSEVSFEAPAPTANGFVLFEGTHLIFTSNDWANLQGPVFMTLFLDRIIT